jgi:hypothetical protein
MNNGKPMEQIPAITNVLRIRAVLPLQHRQDWPGQIFLEHKFNFQCQSTSILFQDSQFIHDGH